MIMILKNKTMTANLSWVYVSSLSLY